MTLTKEASSYLPPDFTIGGAWQVLTGKNRLGFNFGGNKTDLDLVVAAQEQNGEIIRAATGQNRYPFGCAIVHSGDNRTGRGEDAVKESVTVSLQDIDPDIYGLTVLITSFRGCPLKRASNIEVVYSTGGAKLDTIRIPEVGSATAAVAGVIRRETGGWVLHRVRKLIEVPPETLNGVSWASLAPEVRSVFPAE